MGDRARATRMPSWFREGFTLRVVFVLAGLGAGGAEKIVNLLAHRRLAAGDTVHVIALNAAEPSSYFSYDPAIQVEALGRSRHLSRHLGSVAALPSLRRRLVAIQPDIVLSFLTKINVVAVVAASGLGIPLIISERNNFELQQMNPFWRWAQPLAAQQAAGIVMQTESARARLPARLKEKAAVVPNPITPSLRRPPEAGPGLRAVAVGRLDRQKGFDLLLDAFCEVVRHLPEATLTIYGEGPERPALERQISDLGLDRSVDLAGVSRSPGDWLSPGAVFVLSSRFEGFPNVLLEAMAGGMAVVSSDCPWGPSEIVQDGHSGLLVPCDDSQALAAAITRTLTDPELRSRLCRNAPASLDRYSTASVLDMWDAAIARALDREPVMTLVKA